MNRCQCTRFLMNTVHWTGFVLNAVQWTEILVNKTCPKHFTRSGAPLFPSKSAYLLDKNILAHSCSLNSAYLLDQNILVRPLSITFYVPTWQKYSSAPSFFQSLRTYLTEIFKGTLFLLNSTYLLIKDILAHPLSIKFKYLRDKNNLGKRSSINNMQPSANDLGILFEWRLRSSNDNTQPSAYDLGKLLNGNCARQSTTCNHI
jgi:hypothetical protein